MTKETWEKFHLLKCNVEQNDTSRVNAFMKLICDVKFVIYLGGAAQVM